VVRSQKVNKDSNFVYPRHAADPGGGAILISRWQTAHPKCIKNALEIHSEQCKAFSRLRVYEPLKDAPRARAVKKYFRSKNHCEIISGKRMFSMSRTEGNVLEMLPESFYFMFSDNEKSEHSGTKWDTRSVCNARTRTGRVVEWEVHL